MSRTKTCNSLDFFYPYPETTGYTPEQDNSRFKLIAPHIFGSVLDIGCGTSTILTPAYGIADKIYNYTGTDIRPDALDLARRTYPEYTFLSQLPKTNKYSTVLMLGVNMFNVGDDIAKNKKDFVGLLKRAWILSSNNLLFSVCREPPPQVYDNPCIIKYSYNEVENLAKTLTANYSISTSNSLEFFVLCQKP